MSGKELKDKIASTGVSVTEVGRRIGMTQPAMAQALSAADIKSGFLEKIASALNMRVGDLYNESIMPNNTIKGSNAINVGSGSANAGNPDVLSKLMDELSALRAQNEKLIERLLEQSK